MNKIEISINRKPRQNPKRYNRAEEYNDFQLFIRGMQRPI